MKILFHSEAKITLFYLFLFAFIVFHLLHHSSSVFICYRQLNHWLSLIAHCHSFYHSLFHSLSLVTIGCRSLIFVVIRCQSLSLVVPYVVFPCTAHCRSLAFVVIRSHSLPLVIIFIINSSLFNVDSSNFKSPIVTCCHSLSLGVPLVCLFINDPKIFKNVFKNSRHHANTTS